ncbi:MAG: M12 family metallo-peptidase [Planctomycetota bacterium]
MLLAALALSASLAPTHQTPIVIPADAPVAPDLRILVDDGGGKLQRWAWTRAEPASGPASFSSTAGVIQVAELALDADFEFFLIQNSSVEATVERLLEIIGGVNQQFESQVGLRNQVTTIVVRTDANDPYSGNDTFTTLNQMQVEWNTNLAAEPRDYAYLATGRDFPGGTLSISWVASVCDTSIGYCLAETEWDPAFACVTDLTSRTLARCWNAQIVPGVLCLNNFLPSQVADMQAFAATATCLDTIRPGACTVVNGSGVNPSVLTCFDPPVTSSTWRLALTGGAATTTAIAVYGALSAPIPTLFGEILVDLGSVELAFVSLPSLTPTTIYEFPIPANPALVGLSVHAQGLVDFVRLTNAVTADIGG